MVIKSSSFSSRYFFFALRKRKKRGGHKRENRITYPTTTFPIIASLIPLYHNLACYKEFSIANYIIYIIVKINAILKILVLAVSN
jgi:hypothetical protein